MTGSEYADKEMQHVKLKFGEKLNDDELRLFRFIIMEAYNEGKNEGLDFLKKKRFKCFKCEDTGGLVRYGNKALGEPNLVYSDCECKVTKESR